MSKRWKPNYKDWYYFVKDDGAKVGLWVEEENDKKDLMQVTVFKQTKKQKQPPRR